MTGQMVFGVPRMEASYTILTGGHDGLVTKGAPPTVRAHRRFFLAYREAVVDDDACSDRSPGANAAGLRKESGRRTPAS